MDKISKVAVFCGSKKGKNIIYEQHAIELAELLASGGRTTSLDLQDIETDSLGQGTALTDSDNITSLDANEGRGAIS